LLDDGHDSGFDSKKVPRRKRLFATHNPSIVPQLGLRPESGRHPGSSRQPVASLGLKR
jgi:hypothetical protein